MVFMACAVGYPAYRTEEVDHAVPVRIIGPDGSQSRDHSRACSYILRKQADPKKAKRFISAHVWMLNVAHLVYPDAAERFMGSVAGCREVLDAFVTQLKISSSDALERDGSMWLAPPVRIYTRVSDALIASGVITAVLKDEVFGGQDPSKVNSQSSRLRGKTGQTAYNGRFRTDTDRRLRLRSNPSIAPRFDDPRCYERLVEGLKACGASEAILRMCGLGRHAGGRSCQIRPLTVYDVLVLPKAGKVGVHIRSPNKGSAGDRRMNLIPGDIEMSTIFDYMDGERARLSGVSLAELRLMAADPRRRKLLKSMPLFTEDGVNFVKYMRLYSVFRRAATLAGLWIDDEEYRETGKKRYVTFHYLRHEYVHGRLDAVAKLPTLAERLSARQAIIAYMHWASGEAMLQWYSAHHVIKVSTNAAEEFNSKLDAGLATRANSPVDGRVDHIDAEIEAAFEELT